MRWRAWTMAGMLAAAGLGLLGGGCDDPNDVPPDVLKARQQAAEQQVPKVKPPPTTRELLTGPKTRTPLGAFPVSLEVPKDWKLQSIGEGTLITMTGPASSGEINIQLINQGTATAGAVETMTAQAKKEVASKPHPVNRVDLRTLGPAKLLEQRMLSGEFVNGKPPAETWGDVPLDAFSKATTRAVLNPILVKWSFTLFIPAPEGKYGVRTVAFMALRLSEYEQDKEFLEQLMKSLQFEE
jgi:hypothetical protein